MLAKDEGGGETHCPSVYIDTAGLAHIPRAGGRPRRLRAASHVLPGERVVGINMQVILDAVDRYRAACDAERP